MTIFTKLLNFPSKKFDCIHLHKRGQVFPSFPKAFLSCKNLICESEKLIKFPTIIVSKSSLILLNRFLLFPYRDSHSCSSADFLLIIYNLLLLFYRELLNKSEILLIKLSVGSGVSAVEEGRTKEKNIDVTGKIVL